MTTRPRAARLVALTVLVAGQTVSAQQLVESSRINPPEAGLEAPLWTPERPPAAGRALRFTSLPDLLGSGRVRLSNADGDVDPLDWRAVAITDASDDDFCTVTLVGPRVALLAAHCVDAGRDPGAPGNHARAIELRFGSNLYPMSCEIPTEYSGRPINPMGAPRSAEDFALCDANPGVTDVVGVDFEVVKTDAPLSEGHSIQLMGYGCTNLGLTPNFRYTYEPGGGKLRMGLEQIDAVNISIYPGRSGIYLRTKSSGQEPVLCFGDSGGPVLVGSNIGPGRRVVAVNSGVGATPTATPEQPAFFSYLAPLNSRAFVDFLTRWVQQPGVPAETRRSRIVCGFNRPEGLGGCRQ